MTAPRNPFVAAASEDAADAELVRAAGAGDAAALDRLVRRHQSWVYNLALRYMLNPQDAGDLAQEAMIRVVTRIGQFEGRSAFRTWAYRIVANAFLDAKRGRLESQIVSFDTYGRELDALPLQPLPLAAEFEPERALIIEEAKTGCMLGMLLCLSREQRLAYILGEIFEAPSEVAAEILEISAAAFRKRLQRARGDLIAFMQDKCGLINKANPCRCEKKTRAFMEAGWLDPKQIKFADRTVEQVKAFAPEAAEQLDDLVEERYAALFREHPRYPGPDLAAALSEMLEDEATRKTFKLD